MKKIFFLVALFEKFRRINYGFLISKTPERPSFSFTNGEFKNELSKYDVDNTNTPGLN